jgi:hypothetical protein
VNQDMIVTVSVKSGSAGGQGSVAQSAADPPPPMAFDAVQGSSAFGAPAPKSAEQLAMISSEQFGGDSTGDGIPPRPMELASLQSGSAHSAPSPADFASLQHDQGPPAPSNVATLSDAGNSGAPAPLTLNELGVPAGDGESNGPASVGKKRDR